MLYACVMHTWFPSFDWDLDILCKMSIEQCPRIDPTSPINPCSSPPAPTSNRKPWRPSRQLSRDFGKDHVTCHWCHALLDNNTEVHLLVPAIAIAQEVWSSGYSPQGLRKKACSSLLTAELGSDSLGGSDQVWFCGTSCELDHYFTHELEVKRSRGRPGLKADTTWLA